MDLHTIDKMFCAYQKNGVQNEGSVEDLRQSGTKPRTKILSVIDGRRAQNCTILLSKLKMSDEEICRAILRMDTGEQLPIDMVEQLVKFTPSAEEAALLEEHQDELDSMARADRFLYEISKIPHYSQRVRTLLFKKKFAAAAAEASARATTVLRAAREMMRSRKLKALLEVVLALGNYMNRGARGNASGFRLSSLNKLADTKSSVSRNTTLLHYLVELLETQFKEILLLEEDLPHVRAAAKVCAEQLSRDVAALRGGLHDVARELDWAAQAGHAAPHDAFLPVMRDFHAHAACAVTQLGDLFQDMKSRLEACAQAFGEEPTATPEQLFGALDTFLAQLGDVRAECDAARRRRHDELRRTRHEQEVRTATDTDTDTDTRRWHVAAHTDTRHLTRRHEQEEVRTATDTDTDTDTRRWHVAAHTDTRHLTRRHEQEVRTATDTDTDTDTRRWHVAAHTDTRHLTRRHEQEVRTATDTDTDTDTRRWHVAAHTDTRHLTRRHEQEVRTATDTDTDTDTRRWHVAAHTDTRHLTRRHEQELKKRTMERKQASSLLSSVGKSLGKNAECNGHANGDPQGNGAQKGEFDDLISALRTGDVFGDDVAKFKRSRKASKASHKGRDSPPRVCREDSRERQKN
ncbi:hypothetical protein ACJJTC_015296 [Scirpophaga incertulas]